MPTTIKLKNSVTTTNAPSSLVQGEVAINITDKKVWVGNAATTPIQLLGDGGSASFTSIAFGAGTVSSPSITFTGDTNTGIYSPAADTIAFTEGGVESMRINSSGNVGVGTSTINERFRIKGTSTTGSTLEPYFNCTNEIDSDFYIYVSGSGVTDKRCVIGPTTNTALAFLSNGSERMRIDSSGNVGIGTSSPTDRLVVSTNSYTIGKIESTSSSSSRAYWQFNAKDTSAASMEAYVGWFGDGLNTFDVRTGTSHPIRFATNNTERMRIDSSGNVGIGTSSPTSKLHVKDGTVSIENSSGYGVIEMGGSSGAFLDMKNPFSDDYDLRLQTDGSTAFLITAGSIPMTFQTNNTERMRITSDGILLVNLTSAPFSTWKNIVDGGTNEAIGGITSNVSALPYVSWNKATSGNNQFIGFYTETTITARGAIDYNRSAGQVRYNTTSDATFKNIIGDSDGQKSVDILKSTKIREFAWKDDAEQKPQIGVIAQELYETYKGAVSVGGEIEKTDDEGNVTTEYKPWGVDKTAFTFHLIAGWQAHEKLIQEQQAMIEELKQEVAALKAK